MRNGILVLAIIFALLTLGCNKANKNNNSLSESELLTTDDVISPEAVSTRASASPDYNATVPGIDPKVIKSANVSIEVSDYLNSRQKVDSIVQKYKGYITNEAFQETETQKSNSITIRVPAKSLNLLLSDIAAIAKRVDYQNIYTQDVTDEYIDVSTRLKNKLQVEKTYRRHLREATNIEDILRIENKLAEIRTEIESAQGRLKYINNQVSLSTVSLYLYQKLEYKYIPEKLPGFWQRVKEGFYWGWRGLLWFAVLLVKLWPLWLVSAIGYFLYKGIKSWLKNRKKKNKKNKKLQKKTKDQSESQEQ